MITRVCVLQYQLGGEVALEDKLHLLRRHPDFVCLPEYFFIGEDCPSLTAAGALAPDFQSQIARLSTELRSTVIGGSIVKPAGKALYNTSMIYSRGSYVGEYAKINLYGREPERGITPGEEYRIFEIDGVRISLLICADALNLLSFKALGRLGAEVIFVPTISPYRPEDTAFDKQRRDAAIFLRGAQAANAYVVKAGGIGTIFGNRLQGRSGVFAPWGILARTSIEDETKKRILTVSLNIQEIREFKEKMDFGRNIHRVKLQESSSTSTASR